MKQQQKRLYPIVISIFALIFVFISFQNCSPAQFSKVESSSSLAPQPEDPPPQTDPIVITEISKTPETGSYTLSENKIEFGSVTVNTTASKSLQIFNNGNIPLIVEQIKLSLAETAFALSSNCDILSAATKILPQSTCALTVQYAPTSIVNHTQSLRIKFEGLAENNVEITGMATAVKIISACGIANQQSFSRRPTDQELCSRGSVSNFNALTNNTVTWACQASNSVNCSGQFSPSLVCLQDNLGNNDRNLGFYDLSGTPVTTTNCVQYNLSRTNGGLQCASSGLKNGDGPSGVVISNGAMCCASGYSAINGWCVPHQDKGSYCYANSGCKDGLTCLNHACN